jgi:hypothetical protein
MKTAAGASASAGASRMGQVKKVTAGHLADGQELQLEMQVGWLRHLAVRTAPHLDRRTLRGCHHCCLHAVCEPGEVFSH